MVDINSIKQLNNAHPGMLVDAKIAEEVNRNLQLAEETQDFTNRTYGAIF